MNGNKIKSLYIEQYKGFKNFKIELDEKLTTLVGANGTGKTTILEIIYNILSGNMEYFLDDVNFKSVLIELFNGDSIKFVLADGVIKAYINDKILLQMSHKL